MIVWTIQHISVFNKLQKKGFYRTDKRFICFEEFRESYQWYVSQAKKRIKGWEEDRPVWVWKDRPDLRQMRSISGSSDRIEEYVLLKLDIPADKILFSNFDLWHFILNRNYIPIKGEKRKISVKKSWERMFLTTPTQLKPITDRIGAISLDIQGIIEEIQLDHVVAVKRFKVRVKKHQQFPKKRLKKRR